ncbi:MAG: HDOD domain-containing protein [Gammaproteobacteria bacterium SHHR-1]
MPNALDTWFDFLKDRPLPIQAAIALRVQQTLNRAIASHHDFAEILRFGPGMSIEVFRSLRRLHEPPKNPIETLPHAIAMLGLEPLQLATLRMPSIDRLADEAIPGLRLCFGRAIQSAYFARRWAEIKGLGNPEAIGLAALVDECAEMALWSNAPEQMLAINRLRAQGSTSNDAALRVLGVSLNRLSLRLAEHWFLPPLTLESLSNNVYETRPLCVVLATHLARTIDQQWVNPKSALLLELIQEFLDWDNAQVVALLHRQAAEIARAAQFTGLPMAIHHLPFITEQASIKRRSSPLPATRLVKQRRQPQPGTPKPNRAPSGTDQAQSVQAKAVSKPAQSSTPTPEASPPAAPQPTATHNGGRTDFAQALRQLVTLIQRKLGLQRCLFARQDDAGRLKQELLVGLDTEPLQDFDHELRGSLFFALMQKPVGLWLNSQNRHRYKGLIPKDAGDWSDKDSFMMALFCDNRAVGLIYADNNGAPLNNDDFMRFKTAIEKFSQVMTQSGRCPEHVAGPKADEAISTDPS